MKSKTSTTVVDVENKKNDLTLSRTYFRNNKKYGRIKEVDTSRYAVTVQLVGGGMAAKGELIPVKNPWNQIIHDFGQLRAGLLVELTFTGDQESFPEALVIGLENEKIAEKQQSPTIDIGLYEIFVPGV